MAGLKDSLLLKKSFRIMNYKKSFNGMIPEPQRCWSVQQIANLSYPILLSFHGSYNFTYLKQVWVQTSRRKPDGLFSL